jgi:hypothetical protein
MPSFCLRTDAVSAFSARDGTQHPAYDLAHHFRTYRARGAFHQSFGSALPLMCAAGCGVIENTA